MVAVGGRFRPAFEGVATFPSPTNPLTVEKLLTKAHVRGADTIAFVVPPGVAWSLPLYEIALMTERRARERSYKDLSIRFLTPEESPLAVFGAAASAALQEMLQARGIDSREEPSSIRRTANSSSPPAASPWVKRRWSPCR